MQPFEIFNATQRFHDCEDMRPWLIVFVKADGTFDCFPISSSEYHDSGFELDPGDPDFSATGLNKACFIHDARFYNLSRDQFARRRGRLEGDLLDRFKDYAGL